MEQLNRIELRGVVGNVHTQNVCGKNVLTVFTMATNYMFKDKNGSVVIESTWHKVNAWDCDRTKDAETLEKGDKVHVVGRLRANRFVNSTGTESVSYDVCAYEVRKIDENELKCESSTD